jgi:hypothetical protein
MRALLLGSTFVIGTSVLLAVAGCGGTQTKTTTVGDSASDAKPAAKPAVEIAWNSPQETTQDQVTLKGTVTRHAHVKVGGHRAAVVGTKWSKVVQIRKKGENTFSVLATRKGYDSGHVDASVTRKLSTAEKAELRIRRAERRREEAARRAERRREEAARRAGARALEAAKSYLRSGSFSKKGLYEQLSSSAGEGFTAAEAQYAVDHVGSPWKREAVEAAKSYLQSGSFSRSGLIEQLSSSAGEGFTYEEALYAVNKVY